MIKSLDHLVLTVADLEATCRFYCDGLGMEKVIFGNDRIALRFGVQKINLHHMTRTFEPKAALPTPGSADLCFLTCKSLADVASHMRGLGYHVMEGPVRRTGARGTIESLYFRDPDQNLIEVSREQ